jgi:hypothetical protein
LKEESKNDESCSQNIHPLLIPSFLKTATENAGLINDKFQSTAFLENTHVRQPRIAVKSPEFGYQYFGLNSGSNIYHISDFSN